MKNPWIQKNPWMSLWLSGANAMAGAARGHATAEVKRQAAVVTNEAGKQIIDFWAGALKAPAAAPQPRKRPHR